MIPGPVIRAIEEKASTPLDAASARAVGGGCINECYLIRSASGRDRFFVKLNRAERLPMFEAEAEGLAEIAGTAAIRVPRPICKGVCGRHAYLTLEAIEMRPNPSTEAQRKMGEQLAALHRVQSPTADSAGIGTTPSGKPRSGTPGRTHGPSFSRNTGWGFSSNWLPKRGGGSPEAANCWRKSCRIFFLDYSPAPSLLHGDLWGGNAAFTAAGEPVLFDPATYYGDRETDLAFTEMFGGFGPAFHEAYRQSYPVDPGYERRKRLYNLYHLLNHYNLFGGGYASQAQTSIDQLLARSHKKIRRKFPSGESAFVIW